MSEKTCSVRVRRLEGGLVVPLGGDLGQSAVKRLGPLLKMVRGMEPLASLKLDLGGLRTWDQAALESLEAVIQTAVCPDGLIEIHQGDWRCRHSRFPARLPLGVDKVRSRDDHIPRHQRRSAMAPKKKASPPKKKRVSFSLSSDQARVIGLAGDFNDWDASKHPMRQDSSGLWKKTVLLEPGRYEYKFLVDGQWQNDPQGESVYNRFGTLNNFIVVG